MPQIDEISSGGAVLAYIIAGDERPAETTFVTTPDANLQVGFVVKPVGTDVPRHFHHPIDRQLVGTAEVLVVKEGECELDIYDDSHALIATRSIKTGDTVVLLGGGHGIRMIKETVFLEVKQGPYPGTDEKQTF